MIPLVTFLPVVKAENELRERYMNRLLFEYKNNYPQMLVNNNFFTDISKTLDYITTKLIEYDIYAIKPPKSGLVYMAQKVRVRNSTIVIGINPGFDEEEGTVNLNGRCLLYFDLYASFWQKNIGKFIPSVIRQKTDVLENMYNTISEIMSNYKDISRFMWIEESKIDYFSCKFPPIAIDYKLSETGIVT